MTVMSSNMELYRLVLLLKLQNYLELHLVYFILVFLKFFYLELFSFTKGEDRRVVIQQVIKELEEARDIVNI